LTHTAPAVPPSEKVSLTTKLFYGFGSVAFGVKDNGFSVLLFFFYNQVVGLPAQAVGLAIMVALIVDAFLDPIVGQASDNFRSGWGRRHPFMYAAALPVAVSYLVLWNPPGWSKEALFAFLIVVAIVIRSFITVYEIPSSALAPELSTNYDERTRILSYRYFFGWWGGLTMQLAAFAVFLRPSEKYPTGQLNPEGYIHYGTTAALIMFAAILISAAGTHRHIPKLTVPPKRKLTLWQLAREMVGTLSHRSFLVLMGAGLFNAMSQGLVFSLNLYFNTYFWRFTNDQISFFVLGSFVSAAAAMLLAAPLSKRIGKKPGAQAFKILAYVIGVGPIALRLAGLFPENGDPAIIPIIFTTSMISTTFSIMSSILISSMIADVVEDSELRTGRRAEGLFFSVAAFIGKAVSGVGIFTSSMIIALIGFPERAQPGQVSEDVVRNLGLVYVPTLAILYGIAITFVSLYRITRASHEETLRKLAAAAAEVREAEVVPGPARQG